MARDRAQSADLRRRIFNLLRDGHMAAHAAKILGVNRSVASYHARRLVAEGVLTVKATGLSNLYEPGPKAELFAMGFAVQQPDRMGRSRRPSHELRGRVHRGGYQAPVQGVDRVYDLVRWDTTSEPSGVRYGVVRKYVVGGRPYQIRVMCGPRRQKLIVDPPEEWVSDPAAMEQAERSRSAAAMAAGEKWCREHGVVTVAPWKPFQPMEVGFEIPTLERFGTPGKNGIWADESPGAGRVELETDVPAAAAAFMRMPTTEAKVEQHQTKLGELDDRLERLEGWNGEIGNTLERVVRVQEVQARNTQTVAESLVRNLETGMEVA